MREVPAKDPQEAENARRGGMASAAARKERAEVLAEALTAPVNFWQYLTARLYAQLSAKPGLTFEEKWLKRRLSADIDRYGKGK